ncbi:MAG: ATP-binding cassette domain-containing protein [Pseudomonadota bacterium]
MIEGTSIHLALGGKPILRGVSVHLHPGELVAVCGPNGAGKSTLLGALAGEHASCADAVRYDGRTVKSLTAQELSQRRVVLEQTPTLSAEFTLMELVELGVPIGIAPDHMAALTAPVLSTLGLGALADRYVSELSGGQRHKAHLARVLTQLHGNRQLGHDCHLFLDEPTASLDIGQQAKVLMATQDLARDGVGIFVVLHDLNLAAAYADRVILMREGQVMYSDAPAAVLTEARLSEAYDTPIMVEVASSGQTIIQPRL